MLINKLSGALALVLVTAAMVSCDSNEIGNSKDVAQDKIYQRFDIGYNEGDKNFEAKAQFRFGGRSGTTLVLSKPSNVQFDNAILPVDSGKYSGAYYKQTPDAGSLFGSHSFIFTDINNKTYKNSFVFSDFKLIAPAAATSKKQPLKISFSFDPAYQLQGDDYIEFGTHTDSSFLLTHSAKEGGNVLTIPAEQLKRQKGKELILGATLYRKAALQQNTAEGGDLEIRYTIKPVVVKLAE